MLLVTSVAVIRWVDQAWGGSNLRSEPEGDVGDERDHCVDGACAAMDSTTPSA